MHHLTAVLLSGLMGCALIGTRSFVDDFTSRGAGECVPDHGHIGRWSVLSTGFGCVRSAEVDGREWLEASTNRSSSPSQTHAFLVTGPRAAAPLTFSARLNTVEQNRDGSPPNDWETAWLVWNFKDRRHFYYFVAKPAGWELGKRDPAYRGGQRFLADGKSPAFPLRSWASIKITQTAGHRIRVYADGKLVSEFTDLERPYNAGKIGLYGEDCFARFDDVSVVSGQAEDDMVE